MLCRTSPVAASSTISDCRYCPSLLTRIVLPSGLFAVPNGLSPKVTWRPAGVTVQPYGVTPRGPATR